MVLVKILIYQLSEAEGSAEADIWSMIVGILKSSSMVLILPTLLYFIMDRFVQPLGNYVWLYWCSNNTRLKVTSGIR